MRSQTLMLTSHIKRNAPTVIMLLALQCVSYRRARNTGECAAYIQALLSSHPADVAAAGGLPQMAFIAFTSRVKHSMHF